MAARSELCLTIEVAPAASLAELVAAALQSAPATSVTFRAAPGETLTPAAVKPLIEIAQRRSIAALIADDFELARIVNADGVHLSWSKDAAGAYTAARAALGQRVIVGADAGRSRHDAMLLGEAGADYIAFGIPAHVGDRDTAKQRQIDLIGWWSEIFEAPCVAGDVVDAAHADALVAGGADFIAVTVAQDLDAASVQSWLAPFVAALTAAGKAA